MRHGVDAPEAKLPPLAVVLMATRSINQWLGTSYTIAEVAEEDALLLDVLAALAQGMNPRPKD